MAKAMICSHYAPNIDVTRTRLAYGKHAIPTLKKDLTSGDVGTRQKGVMTLCDYLYDPQHISEAIREGMIQVLKGLLSDPDESVRTKTTECFFIMVRHTIGRDTFLDEEVIPPLSKLLTDKVDIIRRNAHKALEVCSEIPYGAEGVSDAGLVPILVNKLKTEHDEIKEVILDTLHFCMRVETTSALKADAMTVYTDLLKHNSASIRAKAARDIMDLSVPAEGKQKAIQVQSVPLLVELLKDVDNDVRANAAGALMMITITTKGKYTALECNAIEPLVNLVDDSCSETRVNSLKAVTSIAEAPEGRQALQKHIEKLRQRLNDNVPNVVKAAKLAVKQADWEA